MCERWCSINNLHIIVLVGEYHHLGACVVKPKSCQITTIQLTNGKHIIWQSFPILQTVCRKPNLYRFHLIRLVSFSLCLSCLRNCLHLYPEHFLFGRMCPVLFLIHSEWVIPASRFGLCSFTVPQGTPIRCIISNCPVNTDCYSMFSLLLIVLSLTGYILSVGRFLEFRFPFFLCSFHLFTSGVKSSIRQIAVSKNSLNVSPFSPI